MTYVHRGLRVWGSGRSDGGCWCYVDAAWILMLMADGATMNR